MFKRLKDFINIQTNSDSTFGPKNIPLFYGCPESTTLIQATVTFCPPVELKAKGVEISFKAFIGTLYHASGDVTVKLEGEQVFISKQWDMDVEFSKPGFIRKGEYSRQVTLELNSALPSSTYHFNGWMKYQFEVKLKEAKTNGITRTDLEGSFFIFNSTPSNLLQFGQVLPITIKMGAESKGDEIHVNNVNFTLLETRKGRASFTKEVDQVMDRLVNLSINTGWPNRSDGWERTIFISVPSPPTISLSMLTHYLDIQHCLIISMDFKYSSFKQEKIQARLDVDITSPRYSSLDPPQYRITAQSIDMMFGIPTEFVDEPPQYDKT